MDHGPILGEIATDSGLGGPDKKYQNISGVCRDRSVTVLRTKEDGKSVTKRQDPTYESALLVHELRGK
jgi:hypothetical protein